MIRVREWSVRQTWVTAFVMAALLTAVLVLVGGFSASAAEDDTAAPLEIQVSDLPEDPPSENLPPDTKPSDVTVDNDPAFAHVSTSDVDPATVERCKSHEEFLKTDLCAMEIAKAEGSLRPGDYSQAEFEAATGADR